MPTGGQNNRSLLVIDRCISQDWTDDRTSRDLQKNLNTIFLMNASSQSHLRQTYPSHRALSLVFLTRPVYIAACELVGSRNADIAWNSRRCRGTRQSEDILLGSLRLDRVGISTNSPSHVTRTVTSAAFAHARLRAGLASAQVCSGLLTSLFIRLPETT